MPATAQERSERIITAYRVLVELAERREVICYEDLATKMGVGNARIPGRYLDVVASHLCLMGLPALTILVVNKGTRTPPGDVIGQRATAAETRTEVYGHSWNPDLFDRLRTRRA